MATYQALIQSGSLTQDKAQFKLVKRLQELHDALLLYRPPSRLKETIAKVIPGIATASDAPRGLYVYGDVGRGKSMLMDLFYDNAPVVKKRRVHFHAFMQDIHARVHRWRQAHEREADNDPILPIARQIRDETTLLCLDEFEVHDIADAMILARLFTLLFKRGVITVITSNRAPGELYPHGLQRERFLKFVDLLEQKIDVLNLDSGTDYRLQKLKAMQQVFISPLNAQAATFMADAFDSLTQHASPVPYDMKVQGRSVTLPRTACGVAWSSFDDLCVKALGTKDYSTLAEEFHTLLLEGVPQLTPEKRNEARRFVTLIDALYEHKVKLVMSMAAPVAELYPAGDGAFEFHRTVSRLEEMQSGDYLATAHTVWEDSADND